MKKGIIIILIIAVIVIGIICGMSMKKNEKQNTKTTNNNAEQNENINTEIINEVNEIEESAVKNVLEENTKNTTSSESFDSEVKTEEEKAIQIVKKDYGTSTNVKFSIEGIDDNGRQVVVVRNIQTTEALAFYFVNVSDNTFTKKEMN